MKLYILRHAIAAKRGSRFYPGDDRPLTNEGIRKMKRAEEALRRVVDRPGAILTSPLKRAYQTAEIAAAALGCLKRIDVFTELLPGARPEEIAKIIFKYKEPGSVMIVGHEPDLSRFIAYLLGSRCEGFRLKKGGLCRIDVSPGGKLSGKGALEWYLTPKLLFMLAGRTRK
jgi:phosphohistidine phosphatase